MQKVVIISGNPSKKSRLSGVLNYIAANLLKKGCSIDEIHVVDLPAEDLLHARFDSPAIKAANKLVENANILIVATPVYKASYTGILKAFLDLIPQKGLEEKIILPVVMGGTTAHLLMIEYALKPVLSVLGATQIEQGVFILDKQVVKSEIGQIEIHEEVKDRLQTAMEKLSSKSMNIANVY